MEYSWTGIGARGGRQAWVGLVCEVGQVAAKVWLLWWALTDPPAWIRDLGIKGLAWIMPSVAALGC